MKRIISILLVVTLAFGLTSLVGTGAVADTTSTNSYATVTSTNGYGVRMREGPGTNYNVVTKYPVNTTVIVLQKGSEWSQITVGDLTGWMMNQYLVFGASGTTPGSTTPTGVANATVTSGNGLRVWLRATAGGKRLALYRPGTQVTVLEKGDKWCRISIGGSVGYMMTEFLDFGSAPAPATLTVKGVTLNYDYPAAGDVLEASLNPAEATVTYSWKVNGVEQSTASTFTVLARYEGQKITLDVKGTGAYTGSAHTQTNPVQNDPYIKGVTINKVKPVVGDVLTAQVQPSSATVDYAWRVGGTLMGSDATYTVQPSDVGKPIQLKVTGIGEYTGSAVATATANVTSQYELQSVTLNKETPVVGDVLTTTIEPQSASVSVAWYVGGQKVADTASYKVDAKDLGQKVEVKVTGVTPYSGTVNAVTNRVVSANLTSVAITGTAREGEILYTKLSPASASASYQWYLEDGTKLNGETSASLKLNQDWIDKKVYVVATGAGAYGGQVTSGMSAVIESSTRITGVKLNLNAPVVGDTLKATVLPSSVNDHAGELSFVWTIDTQTVSGKGMNSYTIKEADKGKQIRVQVIGVAPYTGEAYSNWTDYGAAGSAEVNGLWIYNTTLEKSANDYAPEVGNELRADTNPGQATVTYQWYVGNDAQKGATKRTFIVPKGSEGKTIKVTVQGTGSYYVKSSDKTRSSYTKAVASVKPLNVKMTIAAPEAGKTPVYSVADVPVEWDAKGNVTKVAKGTVTWTSTTHSTTLDEYNHYWGGDAYVAVLTVTPPSGYSCTTTGAKVTLNGKTAVKQSGNTWTFEGFATGVTQVSDFNITGIPRPVAGEQAVTPDSSSSQYALAIDWDGVTGGEFMMQEEYKATITLTAKEGFTLKGVPANAFKVSGADEVTSTASADEQTLTIIAVYKVPTALSISADSTQVEMDGVNRRIVQLKAQLSNGVEFDSEVTWGLSNVDANGTIIENYAAIKSNNSDVKLVINPVETVGKSIKITAAYKDLKAETTVALVSGSNYDNGLQVVITQAARSKDADGNLRVKLSAYVRNSLLGVNWLEPSAGAIIQKDDYNAELVVSAAEIATFQDEMAQTNDTFAINIMVRAESQEDKSLQGKLMIDIPKEERKSVTDFAISGIATPVVGQAASQSATAQQMNVSIVKWEGVDGSNVFVNADEYTATLHATPKAGYTFKGSTPKFTVEGAKSVSAATLLEDGKTLAFTATFAGAGQTVTLSVECKPATVMLSGSASQTVAVNASRSDGKPVTNPVYKVSGNTLAATSFKGNMLTIAADEPASTLTVTVTADGGLEGSAYITLTRATKVKDISITGITPELGKKAVKSLNGDGYTGSIKWENCTSNDVFIAADKYTAIITINAADGYDLTGVPVNVPDFEVASKEVSVDGKQVRITAVRNVPLKATLQVSANPGTEVKQGGSVTFIISRSDGQALNNVELNLTGDRMDLATQLDSTNRSLTIGSDEKVGNQFTVRVKAEGFEPTSITIKVVADMAVQAGTGYSFAVSTMESFDGVQISISDADSQAEENVTMPEEENGDPSEEDVNTGLFEDQQSGETPAEEKQDQQSDETPAGENQNQQSDETPAGENQNQQSEGNLTEETNLATQPAEELNAVMVNIYTDVTKSEKEPEPEAKEESKEQAETGKKDKEAEKNDKVTEEEIEYEEVADEKSPYRVRLGRSHSGNVYAFRVSAVKDGAEITSVTWRIKKGEDAKALSLESDPVFKVSAEKTFSVEYTVTFADGGKLVKVRTIKLGKDAETKKPAGEEVLENPAAQDEIQQPAPDEKEMGDAATREGNVDVEENTANHEPSDTYKQQQKELSDF